MLPAQAGVKAGEIMKPKGIFLLPPLLFLVLLLFPGHLFALGPMDIIIAYNDNMAGSKDVALYYAEKRKVPLENLIGLNVTDRETISRKRYETEVAAPIKKVVKKFLAKGSSPLILLV